MEKILHKDGRMREMFYYNRKLYPEYIKRGGASFFIEPFAKQFCKGNGLDIGGISGSSFLDAKSINILNGDGFNAYNLPNEKYDYIFSSHTLEHIPNYVEAIEYWKEHLKENGVLFLYLPHPSMEYWLPQNNRKHLHLFYPEYVHELLEDLGFKNVLHSEQDLYWSFAVMGNC